MIIFRAVFLELLGPFNMTLIVMVGLLMMEKVYRLVTLLVERRLLLEEMGWMLLYLLPQVLTITLPLAVVGAVFVTVIRQSMDSEVISLRATGLGLWNYARPFLAFGLLVTLASTALTLWLQPTALRKYSELQVEMVRWRAEQNLVPGEFNYDFGGKVIRVGGRNADRELMDIFISDRRMSRESWVIAAKSGWIEVDQETRQVVFRLRDGQIYSQSPDAGRFQTAGFQSLRYVLDYKPARSLKVKGIRTIPTTQLIPGWMGQEFSAQRKLQLRIEFQRRIATPWAALAFAMASIPMALVDPRSGKRAGYLRAIFLVVAYFIVWAAFLDLSGGGKAPPETLWLPAILVFVYGMLRLWQMNADIESIWRYFRR